MPFTGEGSQNCMTYLYAKLIVDKIIDSLFYFMTNCHLPEMLPIRFFFLRMFLGLLLDIHNGKCRIFMYMFSLVVSQNLLNFLEFF